MKKILIALYHIATVLLWLSMMLIGACKVYCAAHRAAGEAVAVWRAQK